MQFSELFVLPEFTKSFFPKKPLQKMDFSHYSKDFKTNSIVKIIDNESSQNDFENLFSIHYEISKHKHLVKKYSFDDFSTMKKCLEKENKKAKPEKLKKELSSASTGSNSSCEYNSCFSCMPNLEVFKPDEPIISINNFAELNQNYFVKEVSKPNYDDFKRRFKMKIKNPNFKTNKVLAKKNIEIESKLTSKHYEKKEFAKLSSDDILSTFERKIKKTSNLTTKLNDVLLFFFLPIMLK